MTEIIKYKNTTALINPAFEGYWGIMGLVGEFQGGIPYDWELLYSYMYKNIFINHKNNPEFVAKVRRFAAPQAIDSAKYGLWNTDPGLFKLLFGQSKKHEYAFNSLLNEIVLSPKIVQCLSTPEAAEICGKYGIGGVSFVEPLFGVIERNGQKIMVYPYIGNKYGAGNPLESWGYKDLIPDLNRLFLANHIEPQDLSDKHLLALRTDEYGINLERVYLIDAEGYIEV